MTKRNVLPSRLKSITCLLTLSLLFTLQSVAAADAVWVRIHHQATHPSLVSTGRNLDLSDYGSFQWGWLTATEVTALRNEDLRISEVDNPFELTLGGQTFDPLDEGTVDDLFGPLQTDPHAGFHLVQFSGPIRPQWLQALRSTGVQVAQPLHPFSYYVWGTPAQVSAAAGLGAVRATLPVPAEWKVQPRLRNFGSETRPTMALASAHVGLAQLEAQLGALGEVHAITPLNRHFRIVHMDIPGRDYMAVAELGSIYTVQYIQQDAGPRNEMSNQSIVGNIDGSGDVFPGYVEWLNDTGYDGSGITVGIVDGGVQESHPDLIDNIEPCTGTEGSCTGAVDTHGTHVAGAVGGTGVTGTTDSAGFLRGQGVAPAAGLVNQAYGPFISFGGPGGMVPEGMLSIYKDSADSGALLTNNSWGPTGSPQGYDIPTQEIDFISRDALPDTPGHQPVLAVWSIMNGNGDSGGACAPSSLGSPDEAKNLFAVGSTNMQNGVGSQHPDLFSVSGNSAHGPACDGRRVPHIVAPGCSTDSTDTGSSYGLKCGTSMASPVVSGAVSVWAEKYIDETGENPSPALIKAVFTAAAQDLVGGTNADGGTLDHRPDRFQGYGRIDLELVMNHGLELYTTDQETVFTSTGEDWNMTFAAVDPNEPIRIMLAWTDAPGHGQGGDTPAWVNDLDLTVEADGSTYLGNVIGGDGWSATGGSADGMNNLEGVFLQPSQHQGGASVTVTAADLAGDALDPFDPDDPSQDFALACFNCILGDPTYTLTPDPEAVGMCVPDAGTNDSVVDVSVGTLGDYTGSVSLGASGEPIGVSSSFNPASVSAPGASDWTLTIGDSAAAGSSTLTLSGDDGSDVHEVELALELDEPLGAVSSLAPTDGAADISTTPTFSWDALAEAHDYRIQVSTNAGFSGIVIDETVSGTSFTPTSDLNTGSQYYWRVRGENLCGGGNWSAPFTFSTRLQPEAVFSTMAFAFSLKEDEAGHDVLTIGNDGTGNLTFDITPEACDGTGTPAAWLSLTPTAGSIAEDVSENVAITVNTSGMSPGNYPGELCVATNDEAAEEVSMPVDLEVTERTLAPPALGLDPASITASVDEGGLGSTSVELSNDGEDTLEWMLETIPAGCTLPEWVSAGPQAGELEQGESEMVTLDLDATDLAPGDYQATLCLASNDAASAHVEIDAAITVIPTTTLIEGTVESLGHCQDDPSALDGALIQLIGQQEAYTTTTDASGGYSLVVPADEAPVSITASKSGHRSETESDVGLVAGETQVADFGLILREACAAASPQALAFTLAPDEQDAAVWKLSNADGGDDLTWSLETGEGCHDPADESWLDLSHTGGIVAWGGERDVTVSVDSTGLAQGMHTTTLCISTSDAEAGDFEVFVELDVRGVDIFHDRFESGE